MGGTDCEGLSVKCVLGIGKGQQCDDRVAWNRGRTERTVLRQAPRSGEVDSRWKAVEACCVLIVLLFDWIHAN